MDTKQDYELSTVDFPTKSALSDWMDHLSKSITHMEILSHPELQFNAHCSHIDLGALELNFLKSSPQKVLHTPEMIAQLTKADYDLLYLDKSPIELKHFGRTLIVPEGNFVLIDNREPYELLFKENSNCLTVHLDSKWIKRYLPHPEMVTARPILGKMGWAPPMKTMLKTIQNEGLSDVSLPRDVMADHLGHLLALMTSNASQHTPSRYQASLFSRLNSILHEQYDDSSLCPGVVAQQLNISKRHLHSICAQASTTFGATLMEIRLQRAAERLKDKRFNAYSIGDIAWCCGFSDPSHFARRFRKNFNTSPVQYRKLH